MELLIASSNSQKVLEIRQILKQIAPHIHVISLFDFPNYLPPKDSCVTFQEFAALKACNAAKSLKKISLADDSGLIIPSLFGMKDVIETRKKSRVRSFAKELLGKMAHLKDVERNAFLESSLAVASPEGLEKQITVRSEGLISQQESGKNAVEVFDTIFLKHDYRKTLAELPPSVRERICNRRKGIAQLLPTIEKLLLRS